MSEAAAQAHRQRELVTAEGLALPLAIASRGARVAALLIDLAITFGGLLVFLLLMMWLAQGLLQVDSIEDNPVGEVLSIVMIMALFLVRYVYFLWFELGPRGATPGKRALGIRVAARPSASGAHGRLTAEAVLARNLMRDVEVFVPTVFLVTGGYEDGLSGAAAGIWILVFLLFPFFNRDNLRAGDLVAATWVVEVEKASLPEVMSATEDRSATYRFGEAELSVYGEHELQVLETVLRQDRPEAMREVAEAICRKIGWQPGAGDERAFLETFYAALRARLERDMRFGRRKKDKFG